jgi:hypothetical protein
MSTHSNNAYYGIQIKSVSMKLENQSEADEVHQLQAEHVSTGQADAATIVGAPFVLDPQVALYQQQIQLQQQQIQQYQQQLQQFQQLQAQMQSERQLMKSLPATPRGAIDEVLSFCQLSLRLFLICLFVVFHLSQPFCFVTAPGGKERYVVSCPILFL